MNRKIELFSLLKSVAFFIFAFLPEFSMSAAYIITTSLDPWHGEIYASLLVLITCIADVIRKALSHSQQKKRISLGIVAFGSVMLFGLYHELHSIDYFKGFIFTAITALFLISISRIFSNILFSCFVSRFIK